ncbi:DUF6703 family protein [Micromonospora sp. NPDC050397]|uniref:DUF6703 family protein n=1 Tax=Micromonospora sp. NPDC050397 TaxID=3364279 RepID=UPI00384AFC00
MQRTQSVVLTRLARVNPIVVLLATVAVTLVGLLAPGIVGGAVLLALAAGLVWLLRLTWPVQPAATRLFRLLMLVLLVTVALVKIL